MGKYFRNGPKKKKYYTQTVQKHQNGSILLFLHRSLSLGCWGRQGMCYVDTQTGISVSCTQGCSFWGTRPPTVQLLASGRCTVFHWEPA